ncbi:hypothetical protein [Maricaulis sp.]|uniref:hypothetical protein n=1 Tax=Maricaulis sp. TaxID=1486257 RepID=UPI0025B911B8|nr:hypothetical protein [Maricaulis sp.]
MKHHVALFPVLAVTLLVVSGPASAQARLERECSADDIRQALAGDYAGPPCRFTQMPDTVDAASVRAPSPQLAGAAPVMQRPDVVSAPAPLARRQGPQAARGRPLPAAATAPTSGGTVQLDDSFFSGGLVGGVGQVPTIQYGYRGIIVIDGAGRASLLPPGQVSNVPVLRMQARGTLRTQLVGQ